MPKHVESNLTQLSNKLENSMHTLQTLGETPLELNSQALSDREKKISDASRDIKTYSTAIQLQKSILNTDVSELVSKLQGKYRLVSWRPVNITLGSGANVNIWMPYYARKCAMGKGVYPHAGLIGLIAGSTPLLASQVSRYASALSSFGEAKLMLEQIGVSISEKRIRSVTLAFAKLAHMGRLAAPQHGEQKADDQITRLLISTDGGRVRIRERKKGPKTKKGRSRYKAEWREPKLIIIMAIGDDGRPHKQFPPIIDATMGGPDLAFEMIAANLASVDLSQAKLAFVADGARWIWERVSALLSSLNLKQECQCLVDFYHVCTHLETIACNIKGWDDKEKRRWTKKMRKWLRNGKKQQVIEDIERVCKGTRNKVLKREKKYFKRHFDHMDYQQANKAGLPMGSGAVESAIRRVINLKLKGPGIIWNEDTIEKMLTLRSYFKAGRWNQLEAWAASCKTLEYAH